MNTRALKKITATALVCMFSLTLFTTAAQAASRVTLNGLLKNSGMTMKIQWLNRTDGFLFGLTFAGKNIPTVTIAPGLQKMLLVQVNGSDMIFQKDATGTYQIIQASGDLTEVMCVLNAVVDFLKGLQTCTTPVCLFTSIMTMVTSITACGSDTTQPTG